MTRATFFQHFDLLADQPNAVARLRELVLQLAVQGRLVPQNPKDESAKVLLERIDKERARRVAAKELEASPRTKIAVLPTNGLPVGWEWSTFGRVSFCRDGERIPVSSAERESLAKTYDYYGASGVIDKIDRYIFDQPLLLIGEDGANLVNRSTPIAFIAEGKYWVNNHAHVLDGIDRTLLEYLRTYINSINLEPYLTGMAQPKMNQAQMNSIPVPLPPLAEQRRIVAKVEELLALCDELEARQNSARDRRADLIHSALDHLATAQDPADFRQRSNFILHHSSFILEAVPALRQTILSLAVQGRLVPQNPKEESGGKLVGRLSRKELPDADHILDEKFPNSWGITAFTNLAAIRSGVTKGRNLVGQKTKCFPYLRVANVQRGHLDLDVMKDIEIPIKELDKFQLQSNDLLVTEGGDWDKVGRTAIWRGEIAECIHQNHVFRGRLVSGELQPEWFMLYFNSPVGRRYFESAAKQTTNLASINASELRECPVPVPPLAEQRRIVAKVSELLALCDELEAHQTAARDLGATLFDSTLHRLLAT